MNGGAEIVQRAREEQYDLIILPLPSESPSNPLSELDARSRYIIQYAHCRVFGVHPGYSARGRGRDAERGEVK